MRADTWRAGRSARITAPALERWSALFFYEDVVDLMMKSAFVFLIACVTALYASHGVANGSVVVGGDGIEVSEAAAQARIAAVATARGLTGAPPESFVLDVASAMYQTAAMSAAAEARGLASEPEVREQLKTARSQVLAGALLLAASREVQVPDLSQAARDYYDTHPEDFRTPARVRVSHILLRFECDCVECDCIAERAQKAKKATELLGRLRAGLANFTLLAIEESEDNATAAKGGSLGAWVTAEEVAPSFAKAAFALEPGEISDVVETRVGYHIIQLDEKQPVEVTPFDEVKDRLVEELENQYRARKLVEFKATFEPDAQNAKWNEDSIARIVDTFASQEAEEVPAIEELMSPVVQPSPQGSGDGSGPAD